MYNLHLLVLKSSFVYWLIVIITDTYRNKYICLVSTRAVFYIVCCKRSYLAAYIFLYCSHSVSWTNTLSNPQSFIFSRLWQGSIQAKLWAILLPLHKILLHKIDSFTKFSCIKTTFSKVLLCIKSLFIILYYIGALHVLDSVFLLLLLNIQISYSYN